MSDNPFGVVIPPDKGDANYADLREGEVGGPYAGCGDGPHHPICIDGVWLCAVRKSPAEMLRRASQRMRRDHHDEPWVLAVSNWLAGCILNAEEPFPTEVTYALSVARAYPDAPTTPHTPASAPNTPPEETP